MTAVSWRIEGIRALASALLSLAVSIAPTPARAAVHMIETINKLVRTSRQMLHEIGREPTPEELAEKPAMPLEKVRKVLKIAKEPISLETPIGDEEDSSIRREADHAQAKRRARYGASGKRTGRAFPHDGRF